MTVGDALKLLRTSLAAPAGEFAQSEAEEVLQVLLGKSRSQLYLHSDREISSELSGRIDHVIARRATGEPLPYILGTTYFHSRSFVLSPSVLIPRPDTETLIEQILSEEPEGKRLFLDIGTGSGAILSALLGQRPMWSGIGTDVSEAALRIARQNSPDNTPFVCADMFSAFIPEPRFDFVVSNPPYVSDTEMEELDQQVRDFEPHRALRGGPRGLDYYRIIAREAACLLKPGGHIYCEIGALQENAVAALFRDAGWRKVLVRKDLSNLPRVVSAGIPQETPGGQI